MTYQHDIPSRKAGAQRHAQEFLKVGKWVFIAWHDCRIGSRGRSASRTNYAMCRPVPGLWAVPGDQYPWTTDEIMERFGQ